MTGLLTGKQVINSRLGQEIFIFPATSKTVLGPSQPPIKQIPGALWPGLKRPECEALSAEAKIT